MSSSVVPSTLITLLSELCDEELPSAADDSALRSASVCKGRAIVESMITLLRRQGPRKVAVASSCARLSRVTRADRSVDQ